MGLSMGRMERWTMPRLRVRWSLVRIGNRIAADWRHHIGFQACEMCRCEDRCRTFVRFQKVSIESALPCRIGYWSHECGSLWQLLVATQGANSSVRSRSSGP